MRLRTKSRLLVVSFDDGHDTGLYTWAYLRELGETRDAKWQHYLDRLAKLGIPYPTPVPARRCRATPGATSGRPSRRWNGTYLRRDEQW